MTNNRNILLIWPDRDDGFYNFDPIGLITGQNTLFFPLPLIYVAAALGEEWNYTLVDEGIEPVTESLIKHADYFMISVNLLQRTSTERLLERLLPEKKPIIIGGPLISTLDHIFIHPGITKVYGEIEACDSSDPKSGITVAECLSEDMKKHTLKKEYHAKGHPDIRKNRTPRYDLVKKTNYFALSMQTSRGCPHHCDFCQQVALYGRHRRKTNEQVREELDALLKLSQNVTVIITDDNLMGDIAIPEKKQEFIELLHTIHQWQEMHEYPFDFFTQCSIELTEHEDVVELMSKIGLNMLFLGIETVDETALASVHKKQNLEQDTITRLRMLQQYGMGIFAGVIIGFDNESDVSIRKQIEFIEKSNIPFVAPMIMLALTGTRLHKRLRNENRISRDPDALTKTFHTNVLPLIHPKKLYGYFKEYISKVYDPQAYFSRCIACVKNWDDSYVIPGKKGSLPTNVRFKRILRSFYYQGIISNYRFQYLKYIITSVLQFGMNYNKLALALYLGYMYQILHNSTRNIVHFVRNLPEEITEEWESRFPEKVNL